MVFDFDDEKTAFHPNPDNPVMAEWKRKNIENYLLIPDAWKRAALASAGIAEDNLFAPPMLEIIDNFFSSQNISLPPNQDWRTVHANIFKLVDGKRILFEDDDSLFHQLRNHDPSITLTREMVAMSMQEEEIHEDVLAIAEKIRSLITST